MTGVGLLGVASNYMILLLLLIFAGDWLLFGDCVITSPGVGVKFSVVVLIVVNFFVEEFVECASLIVCSVG